MPPTGGQKRAVEQTAARPCTERSTAPVPPAGTSRESHHYVLPNDNGVSALCHSARMGTAVNLLDRPVYTFAQVDNLLGLGTTTAQRWIDGYTRRGTTYPPVIRPRTTGRLVATWGEFVECRFLAEYRDAGVPLVNMRPVVEKLRAQLDTPYPLASARLWLRPEGREIVAEVQEQLGEELEPSLYVVRTDDVMLPAQWTPSVMRFQDSIQWSEQPDQLPVAIWPEPSDKQVVIDPLRSFGDPVVRGVQTARLAELARAGDPPEMIADLYDLDLAQVTAALAFERQRRAA